MINLKVPESSLEGKLNETAGALRWHNWEIDMKKFWGSPPAFFTVLAAVIALSAGLPPLTVTAVALVALTLNLTLRRATESAVTPTSAMTDQSPGGSTSPTIAGSTTYANAARVNIEGKLSAIWRVIIWAKTTVVRWAEVSMRGTGRSGLAA